MHFAEFGVVMMLFLIGLELEPARLWKLRKSIIGLGSLQVIITSAALTLIGLMLGYNLSVSLACSIALSLSSTALVLQMMQEKGLIKTSSGELSFAVLLFQDIAIIPILILIPLLAGNNITIGMENAEWFSTMPGWLHTLVSLALIIFLSISGHYFSHHMFHFIAKTNLRELFTATSLALLVGISLVMQKIGVSPALGAFLAGVVLANSEYKHSLEIDIEPFKGLLLGLFFISIGMGMNFDLFANHSLTIIGAVLDLVIVKMIILFILGNFFGLSRSQNAVFAVALSQGGEFAFVLFQYIANLKIINYDQSTFLILVVALSMAATPFLMILNDRFVLTKFVSILPKRKYDVIQNSDNPVIIAGYGRYGQIIGRFMLAQGVKITILEKDADQINLLRKFGNKVYFGDASRLDLLKSAGANKAKLLIVAVDDPVKALEIVKMSKKAFPNLKIFARARNRRHAYELHKAGVDYFRRETFDSSLVMAEEAMKLLGKNSYDIYRKAKKFMKHDEKSLKTSFAFFEEENDLINFAKNTTYEFERILQGDIKSKE